MAVKTASDKKIALRADPAFPFSIGAQTVFKPNVAVKEMNR